MSNMINTELLINGDFEQGENGWQAVNLSLKDSTPDAIFEVVDKPQFDHIITEQDELIKGNYAVFRAGDIRTWLTLKSGIYLPAGEYVWSFAVKSYSTHIMFGMYSSDEVGCDDRLIVAEKGSSRVDTLGNSWNDTNDFVIVNGKYQMEWNKEQIPRYNTVLYRFILKRPTTVFPAIRGRAESSTVGGVPVGLQPLYIDGMSVKCIKEYETQLIQDKEYIAKFQMETPVHNGNYAGLSAIFPCFWFVPDKTMQRKYTEEEIRISTNKFLQMGFSIARCLSFEAAYCWDAENDRWDWDSPWMSGFYKYCDIMQENNIDVIINTVQNITSYKTHLGLKNPMCIVAKANNPKLFETFDEKNVTYEQRTAIAKEFGKWLVDFYNEVVVKRGYTCVRYFQPATEPNNGMESKPLEVVRNGFECWAINLKACHDALSDMGIRNKFKFIGPSVAYAGVVDNPWTAHQWLKWCVEEYDYAIDIYAAHRYGYPYVMGDDVSERYFEFTKSCLDITEKTGKLFWHDEYNVLTAVGAYRESAEQPKHATHIALGQICTMISGSNTTMLWYPVDIKWPNSDITRFPSWENGVHILGLDKSILNGDAVPRYGYYVYCMLGTAIKSGDTVYRAEFDANNQLYTVLLRHKDESYSIITVNMSFRENSIVYNLKDVNDRVFARLEYDPNSFELPKENEVGIGVDEFAVPSPENKIILPQKELKMEDNLLRDSIGPYNVVVYNEIK